jgi:hypothetical protein
MYTLTLTADDVSAIAWSGNRYGWSTHLSSLGEGANTLEEAEAHEIVQACHEDAEGGHSYFPCLSPNSNLASELYRLIQEIV